MHAPTPAPRRRPAAVDAGRRAAARRARRRVACRRSPCPRTWNPRSPGRSGYGRSIHVEIATTSPSTRSPRWNVESSSSPSNTTSSLGVPSAAPPVATGACRRRSQFDELGAARAPARARRGDRAAGDQSPLRRRRASPRSRSFLDLEDRRTSIASRSCSSRSSPVNGSSSSNSFGRGASERARPRACARRRTDRRSGACRTRPGRPGRATRRPVPRGGLVDARPCAIRSRRWRRRPCAGTAARPGTPCRSTGDGSAYG